VDTRFFYIRTKGLRFSAWKHYGTIPPWWLFTSSRKKSVYSAEFNK